MKRTSKHAKRIEVLEAAILGMRDALLAHEGIDMADSCMFEKLAPEAYQLIQGIAAKRPKQWQNQHR